MPESCEKLTAAEATRPRFKKKDGHKPVFSQNWLAYRLADKFNLDLVRDNASLVPLC